MHYAMQNWIQTCAPIELFDFRVNLIAKIRIRFDYLFVWPRKKENQKFVFLFPNVTIKDEISPDLFRLLLFFGFVFLLLSGVECLPDWTLPLFFPSMLWYSSPHTNCGRESVTFIVRPSVRPCLYLSPTERAGGRANKIQDGWGWGEVRTRFTAIPKGGGKKKRKKYIYCGGWTRPGGVGRHDNPIIKN